MSSPTSRLKGILGHLLPSSKAEFQHNHHIHQLSPTLFLERAAAIEPDAEAIYHITTNGKTLRRTYIEFADRARGLAYYLIKKGYKRVGILAPNTPAFLESIYGIVAAGAVIVPVNIRLKPEDIAYIFDFAEVDSIIVDAEYQDLLQAYQRDHPNVPFIIDTVSSKRSSRSTRKQRRQDVLTRNCRTRTPPRASSADRSTTPCWRA